MKKLCVYTLIAVLLIQGIGVISVAAEDTTATTVTTSQEAQTETTTTDVVDPAVTTLPEDQGTTLPTTGETTATTSAFTMETRLIILEKDGKIAARLTDINGVPLSGVAVKIQLGTTLLPACITDADGYAVFSYAMPIDGTYIYCSTDTVQINDVIYTAAAASTGKAPITTATAFVETMATTTTVYHSPIYNRTNKVTTRPRTTQPLSWYTGHGTTGMEESYIALGFAFDEGVLNAFGVNEQDFYSNAKLLSTPENYNTMISGMNGVLMLAAATSAHEVSDEQITAAVQNDTVLSRIDADGVQRIVIDLSMQFLDTQTKRTTDVWNIPTGNYVIQMPIPRNMRSAQTITVSAVTAEGISEPVYAVISPDGFIRFETTTPVGTIALLGFKESFLGSLANNASTASIICFVIGLVCIGTAVFLFFRFVRRPKTSKKKSVEEDEVQNDDDLPTIYTVPEEDDFPAGLDIFEQTDNVTTEPQKDKKGNIDIDL